MFELKESHNQSVGYSESPAGWKYNIIGSGLEIPIKVFNGKRERKFATSLGGYLYHQNPVDVSIEHTLNPDLLSATLRNLAVFVNDWFIDSDITVKLPIELETAPENCSIITDYVLDLKEYSGYEDWRDSFTKKSKYNRITKPLLDSVVTVDNYFTLNELFGFYKESYSYDSVWNSAMNQDHAKRIMSLNESLVIHSSSKEFKNDYAKIVSYIKSEDNSLVILGWFGAIDQMKACLSYLIEIAFERKFSKIVFLSGNDNMKMFYKFKPVQCIKIGGTGRFPDLT